MSTAQEQRAEIAALVRRDSAVALVTRLSDDAITDLAREFQTISINNLGLNGADRADQRRAALLRLLCFGKV